ncbi:flagellar assembly protein FliH [Lederbergia citrea]|uniref:flagellar assembly protein FliH n=1 Tax=Lederbergia citrea TaxID=2833581 RepID=UPI001BC91C2F|nr:flagellar assembly protein FliH [Lederbergia citrea]MBS4203786.1 flagellar assembly protein FliH [Lederbergia citrea]
MSRIIKSDSAPVIQEEKTKLIKVRNLLANDAFEESSISLHREEILQDAEQKAKKVLDEANHHASQLLSQVQQQQGEWEQKKQELINQAYEEGLQIGINEGRVNGYSEYEKLILQAKEVVELSKSAFHEHVSDAESTILELAITAAERIIHSSLAEDHEKFLPIVKKAIKEAREFKEVQIHVHPLQYDLLIAEKKDLDAIFPSNTQCFIYPDAELEEYACFIESENGRIDASISSQLVELKKQLMELLEGDH